MERFQVSITKVGMDQNQNPGTLQLEVKSTADNKDSDVTTVAIFNILQPRARLIIVEALNEFSPALLRDYNNPLESFTDEPKTVQILHKRKSNRGTIATDSTVQIENEFSPTDFGELSSPIATATEHNDTHGKSVHVNVQSLKFDEKVTIVLNATRSKTLHMEEIPDEDTNNNLESEFKPNDIPVPGHSVQTQASVPTEIPSEKLDSSFPEEISLTVTTIAAEQVEVLPKTKTETNKELGKSIEIDNGEEGKIESNQTDDVVTPEPKIPENFSIPDDFPRISSPNLILAIANVILITVEVFDNPGSMEDEHELAIDALNNNAKWDKSNIEPSEESVFEPGTILDFPWHHPIDHRKFSAKRIMKREARKELIRSLIRERLLAFGLPYDQAYSITDEWNTSYVQQRACSYRVPKSPPKWETPKDLNPTMNVEVKAEAFAYNFLRHAEILQGTLDGATCTVIETTFFLMLPHIKMSSQNRHSQLLDSLTSPTFIKDWIQVIYTAAHQLKPSEANSVSGLIDKETKLLRKLLKNVKKVSLEIRNKFKYIQSNIGTLTKKVYSRIEPNPEWTAEIIERNKQASAKENMMPGAIEVPEGLTAANLFENYIHVSAARNGLVIKRHLTDNWYPFTNLNFVERRVIFLGLTDHMYSTFDAILCTLRHLQELYTQGYPLNIVIRTKALLELLRDKTYPYEQLSSQTRSLIYSKMYGLQQGVDRFCHTFAQLSKIIKDAKHILKRSYYNHDPNRAEAFIEAIGHERLHIQLVVPFTAVSLNGLTQLKLRGRGLPHEKTTINWS